MVTKVYSKSCKFCSTKDNPVTIWWSDINHYFCGEDGKRHECHSSSVKDRQLESDKRLNEMLNDLKQEVSSQICSLQKSTAHNTSLLVEIKAKLDGVLRNV
jgi:hypothetical protein